MSKVERSKKNLSISSQKSKRTAKTPFNDNELADIIVTSSDNVDFYLVRAILIVASPFFKDMFSLAQQATAESDRGLDSIQITENSETSDCLMRLCYPVKDPTMSGLVLVERVLESAIKYQMTEAIDLVKSTLRPFITEKPLQVYAIACRQQADEEALLSAQQWKKVATFDDLDAQFAATTPGKSYIPEMDTMSATAYFRLLHFIHNGTFPTPRIGTPPTKGTEDITEDIHRAFILSTADIILRSFDRVDHPANSTILRAASAGKLLEEPRVETGPWGNTPIISVGLHSSVLSDVISFCYPLSITKFEKVEQIRKVAEVAQKYNMSLVIESAKRQLSDISHKYPLPAYFTSVALGWDAEARYAARCAVEQSVDPFSAYTPEMDDVPARHYRSLLDYQHRFVRCMETTLERQQQRRASYPGPLSRRRAPCYMSCPPLPCKYSQTSELLSPEVVVGIIVIIASAAATITMGCAQTPSQPSRSQISYQRARIYRRNFPRCVHVVQSSNRFIHIHLIGVPRSTSR